MLVLEVMVMGLVVVSSLGFVQVTVLGLAVMVLGLVIVSSLGFEQVTVVKKAVSAVSRVTKAVSAVSAVSRVGKEAPKDRPPKTRSQKIVDCQERTERHPLCVAFQHCLEDCSRRASAWSEAKILTSCLPETVIK